MSSAALQSRCSKRRTIDRSLRAGAGARIQIPKLKSSGLLAVACQNLLTGVADLWSVRLQTAENAERIVGIDLQLALAKPSHVRMTSGALFVSTLAHRRGRRLWRECLGICGRCGKDKSDRHHRYPDHGPPICGHPARRHAVNLIS
jgi:hypothetical protein